MASPSLSPILYKVKKHLISQLTGEANDDGHFGRGQNIGQAFDLRWLNNTQPLPVLVKDISIKELQTITVKFHGTP
ncbi:MAG: hypothetical protein ACJASB_000094 [Shewanella psychromarinicola]|jgi:hypothetical protein